MTSKPSQCCSAHAVVEARPGSAGILPAKAVENQVLAGRLPALVCLAGMTSIEVKGPRRGGDDNRS